MDMKEKDDFVFSSPFKGVQVEWNYDFDCGTSFGQKLHTAPHKSNLSFSKILFQSKVYRKRSLRTLKKTSAAEDNNFIAEVTALCSKSEKSEKLARSHDKQQSPDCCYNFTLKFIERRAQKADRRLRKKLQKQLEKVLEEDICSELFEVP